MSAVTKDLTIPEEWQKKFDLVVQQCSGALNTGVNTIKDSLIVMNGIRSLKVFFKTPEVKELVEMSMDSPAGFLTDRSEKAIFRHNANPAKRYELKSYSYSQIVEALIPCVLDGYRMHGNEINIISGKGMPVKSGKFRRIMELTDGFLENISTPAIKDGFAFIKCRAKWKISGHEQSIGYEDGDEAHIKLPYGRNDSLDKARGLAQSKLYTMVLTRITGRFIADEPMAVDIVGEVLDSETVDTPTALPPPTPKKRTPANPTPKADKTEPTEQPPGEPEIHEHVELHPDVAHLQKLFSDPTFKQTFAELATGTDMIDRHLVQTCIDNNNVEFAIEITRKIEEGM